MESSDDTSGAFDDIEQLPGTERDGYVWPDYDERCLTHVPGTVGELLGVDVGPSLSADVFDQSYDNVVVVLVDGLGWDRFAALRTQMSLLDRLTAAGATETLTSVYPSETAAAITSLHTGRTPAEHGLLGWDLRLPAVDRTVQTLPFRTRPVDDANAARAGGGVAHEGSQDLGDATDGAVAGTDLFDGDTVYERLAAGGVDSRVVQPSSVVGGEYGEAATAGAVAEGVDSVAAFALAVRRRLERATDPTYVYAYWPNVDSAAHDEGTHSDSYDAELAAVCAALEREFDRLDETTAADTLCLLTADHGHRQSDPTAAVDLAAIPTVWDSLAAHDDGRPVLPTGGPRNVHLHLQPGTRDRVREALADAPFDARVLDGDRALSNGLFGPGPVSPKLEARVGDLVVVPREVGVWFGAESRKLDFVGQHGGQHPEEMYVPLVATPLDAL